ncbi:MAG: RagB/SusD family nutrient uptake outer membrane protein [Paludibacter sp.]
MKSSNKIVNTLIYFGILVGSLSSCNDFLNEQNKSAITQENYFTTAKQAEAAINGIYSNLYSLQTTLLYGEAAWVSLEMIVGHATTLGQSLYNNGLIQHDNATFEPHFQVLWNGFYEGIANANLSIMNIPRIEMDDSYKKMLMGEAYFLRALFYYYLVRLYGDIPLITEPINYSSPNLYPEKNKTEEIYELIIKDLKTAEESGLPFIDTNGKVSLSAIKSLLASVYLTMAGEPLKKGNEYFLLAAKKAEEIIDKKSHSLFSEYYHLHDRAHKIKGEFIFQIQYKYGIRDNNITEMVTPDKIGISKLSGEIGALIPRDEFINSYEGGDLRTKEKQFFFTNYPSRTNPNNIIEFGEHALYKFWLEEAAGVNGDRQSDLNWTIFRLPEIMLIYAEASNEVNGPTDKAYEQINLIRNRAGLNPLQNLNKDEFREAVWRERYHELCFENKAYFDIQRTHKAYNLKNGHFEDIFSYTNESGVKFTKQYMLWPIPQSEIDANPKLTQNEGW